MSPPQAIEELNKQVTCYLNQSNPEEIISQKLPEMNNIHETLSLLPKGYKSANNVPFFPIKKNSTLGSYLFESIRDFVISTSDATNDTKPPHLLVTGIPGGLSVAGLSELLNIPGIEFLRVNNEPGGAFIADFAARFSHAPVINFNTYGAGTTATIGQVYTAWLEHSPLIIMTGITGAQECHSHTLHHHCDHRNIQYDIFRPITIAQARLDDPSKAAQEIFWLLWFLSKYQLPIYIELPRDMVSKPVVPSSNPISVSPDISNLSEISELSHEVVNIISQSNQPLIMAGLHVLRSSDLQNLLIQFAQKYNIPVVTSFDGKSAFPEDHPLFRGVLAGAYSSSSQTQDFIRNCDLLIKIGIVETDVNQGMGTLDLPENSIEMNIWHIKVGERTVANIYLSDFIEKLLNCDLIFPKHLSLEFSDSINNNVQEDNKLNLISEIFSIISIFVDNETIILTDVGDANFAGVTIPVFTPNCYQTSALNFIMGSVIPGAIAAKKIHPGKKVIAIMGDGAFRMVSQELEIAAIQKMPFVLIVINNGSYRTIRLLHEHEAYLLPRETDLAQVGHAWGVKSKRISSCEKTPREFLQEFHDVFQHAFESIQHQTIPWMIELVVPEKEQSPQLTKLGRELKKKTKPNGIQ